MKYIRVTKENIEKVCDFKQQGYTGNIKEKLAERAI